MALATVQQLPDRERACDPAGRDPRQHLRSAVQQLAQRNVSGLLAYLGPDQVSLIKVLVHRLDGALTMEPAQAFSGKAEAFAIQSNELSDDLLVCTAVE